MKQKQNTPQTLAEYLAKQSKAICELNECSDDQHNCESYAYIRHDMYLMDICAPDYFQGCSKPHAAIPLPWNGTQAELEQAVADDCDDIQPIAEVA